MTTLSESLNAVEQKLDKKLQSYIDEFAAFEQAQQEEFQKFQEAQTKERIAKAEKYQKLDDKARAESEKERAKVVAAFDEELTELKKR